jgi:hypothetical protein
VASTNGTRRIERRKGVREGERWREGGKKERGKRGKEGGREEREGRKKGGEGGRMGKG